MSRHGGALFSPSLKRAHHLPAVAHPATAAEMVDLATLVGLSASPCKVAMDELARLKRPAILHWNLDHWVVLWAVTANGYLIDNPAIGRAWVSAIEVNRAFSGIVIVCEPIDASHLLNTHRRVIAPINTWSAARRLHPQALQTLDVVVRMDLHPCNLPADHTIHFKSHDRVGTDLSTLGITRVVSLSLRFGPSHGSNHRPARSPVDSGSIGA